MSAAAPTPLGVLLSVDPRRTRSPRNPAAAAGTELIAEAATLVIRQAALAEPGSHVAPERPVTLRLPRSGSYRDWPFETWQGRQLLQKGQLAEAAVALEGRFSLEDADRVVGREAPDIVALGKLKIYTGDDAGAREIAEIAKLMLRASAPAIQRHGAWYLALQAMSKGEAEEARDRLCACGHANRLKLFPLYPLEIEDDSQLVRIALAVGDGELAERTSKQSVAVSSTPASSLSRQPLRTRGGCGKARRTNCRARSRSSRPGRARWQRRRHSKISDACRRQRAPPLTQFAHSIAPWRSTRRSAPAGMRRGYAVGSGSWAFCGALPFRSAQSPVGKL
jgi:hypothetical protein